MSKMQFYLKEYVVKKDNKTKKMSLQKQGAERFYKSQSAGPHETHNLPDALLIMPRIGFHNLTNFLSTNWKLLRYIRRSLSDISSCDGAPFLQAQNTINHHQTRDLNYTPITFVLSHLFLKHF